MSACKHTIAIIEPRQHDRLEATIRNALEYSSEEWCVQVFHGRSAQLDALPPAQDESRLSYHALDTDNLNASQYNALLLSPQFWDRIQYTNKVLIMQTDSAFCGNPDSPKLDDIAQYGYIGCSADVSAWGGKCRGIGGFSLRDYNTMRACTQDPPKTAEDVHFGVCGLEEEKKEGGARMPSTNEELLNFCVEHTDAESLKKMKSPPLGVHVSGITDSTWSYIRKTCPAASYLWDK